MPGVNPIIIDISLGAFLLGVFLVIADKISVVFSRSMLRPQQGKPAWQKLQWANAERERLSKELKDETQAKMDRETRLNLLRDEYKTLEQENASLRAAQEDAIAITQTPRGLLAIASKPIPILEHVGLEIIPNVLWFGTLDQKDATIYTVTIRNGQVDVPSVAANAKAAIEFHHEAIGFVIEDAPWITSKSDQHPDFVQFWVNDRVDIGSGEDKQLVIAGVETQPKQSAQPFFSWSVIRGSQRIQPNRWLQFGKWTCAITVSADLVGPVRFAVSFNVDREGKIVNFGSAAVTA